jgi:hypothetical protein
MISKSTLDVGSGTTPADFVYSGDTLVWKRYYDTGLWVHPLNTVNVTFTDFQAQSISGDGVTINWGDGEINLANDSTNNNPNPITHTIDANAGTKAIEIVSTKDDVSRINFGTSGNGTLGGTIDITEYPNIVEFVCNNQGLENFVDSSPTEKTSFGGLYLTGNALTSFPDTSSYTNLGELYIYNNTAALGAIPSNLSNKIVQLLIYNSNLSGEIPHGNLPSSPGVAQFAVLSNPLLTGSVLNSDFTENLNGCNVYNCNFTGSIPSLRWGSSNQRLVNFSAQNNAFDSIADPFVVYAPTIPTGADIGLAYFRIHNNNNIPKADIIRALLAFYIAYVVDNKPGITNGYIRMHGNGNSIGDNELIDPSASLNDPTFDISVGEAKTALAGKGFNTILL